jgi:hypothetical protein
MRTYEDTFSGARIYPGKVRSFRHYPIRLVDAIRSIIEMRNSLVAGKE